MTDLIRWNAGFVKSLAQSVLERAKVIRLSLEPATQKKAGKKTLKKKTKKVKKK
ncbi:MAG: hypothetical protein AB7H97_17995 [Pseudobdellovibrionaceae bacterium]